MARSTGIVEVLPPAAAKGITSRRSELNRQKHQETISLIRDLAAGAKEITADILANPLFTIVLANCLVEYLQTIQIRTGAKIFRSPGPDPAAPGMYLPHQWVDETRPLISQAHATTIEALINTSAVFNAFNFDLSKLIGILKK